MRRQGLFDQLIFVAPISAIFVFTEKLDAIPNDFCRLDAQLGIGFKSGLINEFLNVGVSCRHSNI